MGIITQQNVEVVRIIQKYIIFTSDINSDAEISLQTKFFAHYFEIKGITYPRNPVYVARHSSPFPVFQPPLTATRFSAC